MQQSLISRGIAAFPWSPRRGFRLRVTIGIVVEAFAGEAVAALALVIYVLQVRLSVMLITRLIPEINLLHCLPFIMVVGLNHNRPGSTAVQAGQPILAVFVMSLDVTHMCIISSWLCLAISAALKSLFQKANFSNVNSLFLE